MSEQQEDFWLLYSTFCVRSKVCPLKSVLRHLKGTELCCPVEAIRPEHWLFVLSALCNDNSLTKVHFASSVSPHGDNSVKYKRNKRDKGFPTPYGRTEQNITNISMALAGLLHSSQHLTMLKLENFSIKIVDAEQLSAGLDESRLKVLSLSGCQFELTAIPLICSGLSRSSVSWLDLSSCALSSIDIEAVCHLINAHSIRRTSQMFPETLRYNFANLGDMTGLNRVSLNCNLLERRSALLLVQCLTDDFWMKAIDLQNCGIENEGAEAFLKLASTKCELEIIDLRLNDIDESLLNRIEQQLLINRAGKTVKFLLTPLWKSSEMVRKYDTSRKVKVPRKPSLYKFRIIRKPSRSLDHSSVKSSSTVRNKTSSTKDACVQTSFEMPKGVPKPVQLKNENEQLQELVKCQNDDIYIDQETYYDIKHTFEKLKIFFDVMKKYGLWEYISMLGFDESTDVILTENDSLKQMTVTRRESSACSQDNKCRLESDGEPCCKCRKMDPKHKHTESCGEPEEVQLQNCATAQKAAHDKYVAESVKEYFLKEKGPYRLLQELVNDYNNATNAQHNQKLVPGRQTNNGNGPQDNAKATSSKQPRSLSPKAASGAHMLIKKFSYANMPKKLKELISPADFYKIVKKELERCESEARKPFPPAHAENSSQTSSNYASQVHAEKCMLEKCSELNSASISNKEFTSVSNKESTPVSNKESTPVSNKEPTPVSNKESIQVSKKDPIQVSKKDPIQVSKKDLTPVSKKDPTPVSKKESVRVSKKESTPKYCTTLNSYDDEDFENIPISVLIAREKAMLASKQNQASKYIPTKKEPAKSSVSSSKSQKNSSQCRVRDALLKSDQRQPVVIARLNERVVPKSKLKVTSSSSQTSNKKVQVRSNTSSDEVNSSDTIGTANDKLSGSSVASSSPSCKSHTKSSSNHSESEPQKSYIESVSDASTFRDVKSISLSEVASEVVEEDEPDDESVSSGKTTKGEYANSQSCNKKSGSASMSQAVEAKASESKNKSISSAIKGVPETENGKADELETCKSPVQSTSKKTDRSTKANSPPQGKTKNGKNSKNRPKSNSKSSSIPSFSDITTVSSRGLSTESLMKQIYEIEENQP